MSSVIERTEDFADDGKSKLSIHPGTSSFKNSESSGCQPLDIIFISPEVGTEPCDKDERLSENIATTTSQPAMPRRDVDDAGGGHKDVVPDSTILLDGRCRRPNGEDSFENENVSQTNDEPSAYGEHQSRVEIGSTRHWTSEIENPSQDMDGDKSDLQNTGESKARHFHHEPEVILQPHSLCVESSRTLSRSREEHGIDPPSNTRLAKPTSSRHHSSPSADPGADSPWSARFMVTTQHNSPTVRHGSEIIVAGSPCSVRFIKSARTGRHPIGPTSESGRETRHTSETGRQQPHHPPSGTSCTGGEEIEPLPGESPEPQIVISPSFPDEPRVKLCELVNAFLCRWCGFVIEKICRQFAKAPFFYLFSTLIIVIGVNAWDRAPTDRDVPLAIVLAFGTFVMITLIFDRGQFSNSIGGKNSFFGGCRRDCKNADTCIPWYCCCRSSGPQVERHSQYRHLEEDGAFQHEIADVSRLDPKDFPQMKMVEQRDGSHSESPEYLPEVSQVAADVHTGKRDGEKLGATRKHVGRAAVQTTKPHKTQSARPLSTRTFKADIHAQDQVMSDPPVLSPIPEDETHHGEGQRTNEGAMAPGTTLTNLENSSSSEDLGNNEFSETATNSPQFSGGVFKKFADCSPTLSRFANVCQPETSTDYCRRSNSPEDESFHMDVIDDQEVMCEHYGQGVACSCATLFGMVEEDAKR